LLPWPEVVPPRLLLLLPLLLDMSQRGGDMLVSACTASIWLGARKMWAEGRMTFRLALDFLQGVKLKDKKSYVGGGGLPTSIRP